MWTSGQFAEHLAVEHGSATLWAQHMQPQICVAVRHSLAAAAVRGARLWSCRFLGYDSAQQQGCSAPCRCCCACTMHVLAETSVLQHGMHCQQHQLVIVLVQATRIDTVVCITKCLIALLNKLSG